MLGHKTLTLGRVYDTIRIREGGNTLLLTVNGDPHRMVVGLNQAQKQLQTISADTPEEERREIARMLAETIWGAEQAQKLMDFYFNDSLCVISIATKYFTERLGKKITRMQKKAK